MKVSFRTPNHRLLTIPFMVYDRSLTLSSSRATVPRRCAIRTVNSSRWEAFKKDYRQLTGRAILIWLCVVFDRSLRNASANNTIILNLIFGNLNDCNFDCSSFLEKKTHYLIDSRAYTTHCSGFSSVFLQELVSCSYFHLQNLEYTLKLRP